MIETQDKQETNESMDWSASSKQIETILEEAKKDGATDKELEKIRNDEISRTDRITNREDGTWTHVANKIRRYKAIVNVKDIS